MQGSDSENEEDHFDYKQKIKNFIEMEKLKLVSKAIIAGEDENDVCSFLDTENIADFDLDNFRSRLEERRKVTQTIQAE